LNFAKKQPAPEAQKIWKLDVDDDDEMIDADELLDEEDKKKPDDSSLRVCSTTGKRKACKDCSCGLAEELDAEAKGIQVTDNNPKSSCGSVSLIFDKINSFKRL
jgi:anamorsin